MDNILFIVPPYVNFGSFINPAFNERTVVKKSGRYGSVVTDMPVGLIALSAYLKKHSQIKVRLLDFNVVLNQMESFDFASFSEMFRAVLLAEEWTEFAPTIIGISVLFTPAYRNMLDLGEVLRNVFPNSLIIAGGGVPTNMYREIFSESSCFDALCFGEGEKPMLGLFKAADKKGFLDKNPSWITKKKVDAGESFQYDFIEDLDEIPFYDYDLCDVSLYSANSMQSLFPLMHKEKRNVAVMTSRGCPHRCCFCASHTVHGRTMRYHSIERIREEFTMLKEKYGAEIMLFLDDHFMSNKERVYQIIKIMNDLNLTAFFPSSLALYALDRKILEALKSTGLNHIILSIESGSNRVLREIMHKPLNLSIVERVIADCRELGIATDVSVLIGLPGETKQDIEDARAFFKTISPSWFRFSVATPLVGSEMLQICLERNYIRGDYLSCDFKRGIVETEDFTPEYIQEKAYELNLEMNFVLNGDFKRGNYQVALVGFENTIRVRDDHAFAFYFAAKCCEKLQMVDHYRHYKGKYQECLQASELWRNYTQKFALSDLN